MTTAIKAGDEVRVVRPLATYGHNWFFPGETIYAVEVRGDSVRIRCPESGADDWQSLNDIAPAAPTAAQLQATLASIARDMTDDAKAFDGKEFSGKTVGQYLGNIGAAVAALADVVAEIVPPRAGAR